MQRTAFMPSFTIHSLTADTAEAWSFMKNLQRCKAEMFCAFCFLLGELIANRAVSLYTAVKATQIFCRKINYLLVVSDLDNEFKREYTYINDRFRRCLFVTGRCIRFTPCE